MATAKIRIVFQNAGQFQPVGSSQACTPMMALWDTGSGAVGIGGAGNGTVTIGGHDYALYAADDTTSLTVGKNNAPDLEFSVQDDSGVLSSYFLAGIALQNAGRTSPGGKTFPKSTVDVDNNGITTLTLQDKNNGPAGNTSYDFWLLVQNSSGTLGLVDPRLINSA